MAVVSLLALGVKFRHSRLTIVTSETFTDTVETAFVPTCACGQEHGLGNGITNRTDISMENVANQSVHLHLQHTEIYSARRRHISAAFRKMENIPEDEEQDKEPESTSLGAAFAKTLAMADETENTRALRHAANTFAQLVNGNPCMEESSMGIDDTMSAKTHHTFTPLEGSPWEKAVQGVVDSVNTMAKSATGMRDHPNAVPSGATAPPRSHFFPLTSATTVVPQDLINAVQAAVFDAMKAQLPLNEITTSESNSRKDRQLFPAVPPFRAWLARSRSSQPASLSPVSSSLSQLNKEPYMPTMAALERVFERPPSARTATPMQCNEIPKERMMTIHPLLTPHENKSIHAHRLASLYFTAVLDPCDIPEFKAEYMYNDGRCSCILLTFKNVYDADRLKELWDCVDRKNTRAPDLAKVLLYRGNTSAKPTDTSVRDAAFDELASFRLTPSLVF